MKVVRDVEYLILGAGPAGIQLGYYLARDKRDYLILDKGADAGSSFAVYPKHRKLISINKVYSGETEPELKLRHDWNSLLTDDYALWFADYDKQYFPHPDNMCRYLSDFVRHYQLAVQYDTNVVRVSKVANGYQLTTQNGDVFNCRNLIVGTGVGKPHVPDIPGIELVTQYADVSTELEHFADKSVLVIGKGNSGFETADHLIPAARLIHICSPTPLKLAWKTHFVGNLRAVNNNFLDTYQLKSQNAVLDANILAIEKRGDKLAVTFRYHQADEEEVLTYDEVICCTGFGLESSIFDDSCKPKMVINNRFPEQTSEWESVNNDNMFFIGTVTQMRDYKKANSGFIHGFRYNVKALNTILAKRNHGDAIPAKTVALNADILARQMLSDINSSGALWQQTNFMCGYYAVNGNNEVDCYMDIPKDYVMEKLAANNGRYFVVTLAFGDTVSDPFDVTRPAGHEVDKADTSNFLHPVIEQYIDGEKVSEHHVIENLFGVWDLEKEHFLPLSAYLAVSMSLLTQCDEQPQLAEC